ncbi:F0F1 ATP synthase subunit gamma [Aequorivita viscosa]|uniref:F-type H+-transporting ATPase subunit gamma n=1 Tax=Aequorivita viscosa TaxID=797419 RepID=A0A1M6EPY1_9FLAO|nr:F0F1 ATP synthase subunit gamma [Aequorivita viscosa]SDW04131.1 F-type H+-transporting ATPase subunit gamma [Aequorivita viscosa]SHI87522.1 F-type H+-transporting ATPase subunit gamma [Aequorivita viscosa]
MSDTLINLQRRKQSAGDMASVVRTMKAMATSNITQYENSVHSLQDYYRTISLGIHACFKKERISVVADNHNKKDSKSVAVIFGSDQGLVGRFNDSISTYAQDIIKDIPGETEVWVVGERVYSLLVDGDLSPTKRFSVPNSVTAITPLVNQILIRSEAFRQDEQFFSLYIFHNTPTEGANYKQEDQQLFPPDKKWEEEITKMEWPSHNVPQVIGGTESTLGTLIKEYLFVSLYKASAESLAAENASRLEAMERAEKNIDEMLDELQQDYNRLRQSTIDEELFDVIAGFEALKKK